MQHAGTASFPPSTFLSTSLSFVPLSLYPYPVGKSPLETQSCPRDPLGANRPCIPQTATQQNHLGEITVHEVSHEAHRLAVNAAPRAEVDLYREADLPRVLEVPVEVVDVTGVRVTVALPAQIRVLHKAQRYGSIMLALEHEVKEFANGTCPDRLWLRN